MKKIFLFLGLFITVLYAQEPLIEVSSAVDTSVITIGDRIKYTISLNHVENMRVEKPGAGANLGMFEIKDYKIHDVQKQDGRVYQEFEYTISVFDTGKFTIPAFPVAYFPTDSLSDYKIIEASAIPIYVKSVLTEEDAELRDIKAPIDIPYDYWRLALFVSIGLLLILVVFLAYRFYKIKKEKGYLIKPPPPPRPAHEVALERMQELLAQNYLENGEIKVFYIELSDIVRHYLEGRYFIRALEETSSEILRDMKEQDIEENNILILTEILELSDLVKFAKYIPEEKENINVIEQTENFINSTKMVYLDSDDAKNQPDKEEQRELVTE